MNNETGTLRVKLKSLLYVNKPRKQNVLKRKCSIENGGRKVQGNHTTSRVLNGEWEHGIRWLSDLALVRVLLCPSSVCL